MNPGRRIVSRNVTCLLIALLPFVAAAAASAQSALVPAERAAELSLRGYWRFDLPVDPGDTLQAFTRLDDNLYARTEANFVMAVHADTGVLRWTAAVAEPGQRVLGPTHNAELTLFTAQDGVHLYNRRTGRPLSEKRDLRGDLIEVVHDSATVNLGKVHGVQFGTVMGIFSRSDRTTRGSKLADLTITVVRERESVGRLARLSPVSNPDSGDLVEASVAVPHALVPLPFAPSGAAVADAEWLYYPGSNRRFYKLDLLEGLRRWEFQTDSPISAMPVLRDGKLFLTGQDGRADCVNAKDKRSLWSFATENPIFEPPFVDAKLVYVASTDRSVYALNVKTGERVWRKRFGSSDLSAPVVAAETVFVLSPGQGFFALKAEDGAERWKLEESALLLAVEGRYVYLLGDLEESRAGSPGRKISVVELESGKPVTTVTLDDACFAAGSVNPLTLVVADRLGRVECLRSPKFPHIQPESLADVLAADHAALTGQPPKPAFVSLPGGKPGDLTQPADPFKSTSRTQAVGGHGLVKPPADKATASQPATAGTAPAKPAEDDETPADEADGGDADDKASDDSAASDEENADDDTSDQSGEDATGDNGDSDASSNGGGD